MVARGRPFPLTPIARFVGLIAVVVLFGVFAGWSYSVVLAGSLLAALLAVVLLKRHPPREHGDPPLSSHSVLVLGAVLLPAQIGALVFLEGWLSTLLVLTVFVVWWVGLVFLVRRQRRRGDGFSRERARRSGSE